MSNRGWLNLESVSNVVPDNQFFEGEPAFKFLGLSKKARLYGFLSCLAIGFVLSLLGSIMLFLGETPIFATLYVSGTIVCLVGTGFVIGFFKQLKMMFKPVRVIATIVLFGSIVMVFVAAYVIRSNIICLIFVLIEFLAYTWYTLSYIPYARSAVLKAIGMG